MMQVGLGYEGKIKNLIKRVYQQEQTLQEILQKLSALYTKYDPVAASVHVKELKGPKITISDLRMTVNHLVPEKVEAFEQD